MALVTCPCGATAEAAEVRQLAATRAQTGFHPVAVSEINRLIVWLCPACTVKGLKLARQLAKVVGSERFTLASFLRPI
jgi:hypothetical protein